MPASPNPLGPVLGEGDREIPFGKYTLLRKIAVGGMAEVYLAKSFGQFGFEKPVVIKVLLPRLSENLEFREMFVHEALVAADFRHPRLCQVYDVGEVSGLYYICMEFVDGMGAFTARARRR
jgi:serine/threonine protein kinase